MRVKFKSEFLKKFIRLSKKGKVQDERKNEVEEDKLDNLEFETKVRRRQKSIKDANSSNEVVEPHENKKWRRKGSKITLSEFLNNIFLNKKRIRLNYYALLFFMMLLCGGSIYLTGKTYKDSIDESYVSLSAFSNISNDNKDNIDENSNINNTNEQTEQEIVSIVKQRQEFINEEKKEESVDKVEEKINSVKNIITPKKEEKKLEFVSPIVGGKIQKIYSIDSVIYSKTLDMWKIHNGVDISASIGQVVSAIEEGKVSKIYDDSFFGKTVVIEHINGYISCYCNLSDKLYVNVGDSIKKSQKIGEVGETAIGEIKDGPHIHFMMYKDNQLIDPSSIF